MGNSSPFDLRPLIEPSDPILRSVVPALAKRRMWWRCQPRLMLPLSLSYDHRAVNGADAARFTALLSQLLGDIRTLLL